MTYFLHLKHNYVLISEMSDYEGLARDVVIKKGKKEGMGFKLLSSPQRKGNVSDVYFIFMLYTV